MEIKVCRWSGEPEGLKDAVPHPEFVKQVAKRRPHAHRKDLEGSRGAAMRCTCQAKGLMGTPRAAKRVPRGSQQEAQGSLPNGAQKGNRRDEKGLKKETEK